MTKFAKLKASIIGITALAAVAFATADTAQAQSTLPPFSCSGDIYQVQSGQLRIFDPTTSTYTNIGPRQGSYNATAYNVVDNYAYGSLGSNIVRIGSDGAIETVFNVGFFTYSGDLDRNNNFYLRRSNNRYDQLNLITGVITRFDFSGPGGGPADVAFLPSNGGELIGFSGNQMYTYNIANRSKTRLNVTGGMPGGGYGATWTDRAGRLFTFNNTTGLLFEIFDYTTNAPRAVQVGVGDPSNSNDGFSCPLQNFPNLAPLAQDDDFATPVNVAITGDVTADNGNGIDNDPDGGALVVSGPDTGPTDGTVTLNTDGTFSYTPDVYFLGTDTFTYTVTDPAGLTATATVTIDVTGDIGFEVDKRRISGVAVATAEGDVINYQIEVENTGDIPLTGVAIVDTLPNGAAGTLTGPVEGGGTDGRDQLGRIDVGETWTYTISYLVEQDDIDGGGPLVNTAAVTTTETGATPQTDIASIPVDQDDSFTFTKVADVATFGVVNDPIVFTLTVENTGNVTLTGVVVTDPFFDPDLSCTIPTIAPGSSDTSCSFTYNVTQADIDRGEIINVAAANALGAGGVALPEQTGTATITGPAEAAALRVVKTDELGDLLFGPLNDTETFTFEVFNDGVVTLTNLSINDPALGFTCALADLAPGASTTTCADGITALSADLLITQPLVDAATYTNTVTVTGQTLQGTNLSDDDTLTLAGPAQVPALTTVKTVASGDNFSAVGDIIAYEYLVTNAGNITLTAPITVADNRTSVSCPVLPAGGLAPMQSITCTASYSVTQPDLDAGSVVNVATASVTQPLATGGSVTATSPQVSAMATADADPAISIAKELTSITDVGGGAQTALTFNDVGDILNYTFTVTNTGNVTLTDAITVADTTIGAPAIACPAGGAVSVAPGDSVTCTASYPVTLPDLDAGQFVNSATASTTYNTLAVVTPTPATETVPAQQTPALTLTKTAPAGTVLSVGVPVVYTYVATNSGNVTLTDPITITDDRIPGSGITCPAFPSAGIVPGGTYTCTGSYNVTANDVFIGTVVNNASATSGGATSPSVTEIVPAGGIPALDLSKAILSITDPGGGTASGLQFNEVNDVVTFQFTITNSGTRAFVRPVTVTDPMLTPNPITCFTPIATDLEFGPGEIAMCTGQYTITQTDLDAGEVVNTAFASVEYGAPGNTTSIYNSPSAMETVPAVPAPGLTLTKEPRFSITPANAGETVTFLLRAANTGNQTLTGVSISDPLIPNLICNIGFTFVTQPVTLVPGEELVCSGDYVVTQDDFDAQTLTNTGSVTGLDPTGVPTSSTGSYTYPLAAPAPSLEVIKTLTAGTPTPAYTLENDTVNFTVEVRNNGDVTLSSIDVTDDLVPGVTCTVGPLAPGESDDSCRFVYTVLQGDVDAGQIDNTATALGTPIASSGAAPITQTGLLEVPGPERTPSISLEKDADLSSFNATLQTITYTFTVENTGNVTLFGTPTITDLMLTGLNCVAVPATGLLPGDTTTCSGTYQTMQGDLNAGEIVNNAAASMPNPLEPLTPLTATATERVPAVQSPSISMTKTPDAANFTGANQTVNYLYTITNTGNVTLTAAPVLTDDRIASGLVCDPYPGGELLPMASVDCRGAYQTTQPDVDAGGVTNIAMVEIDDPTNPGTPLTTGATATVPAIRTAVIEVTKTPTITSGAAVGDMITYNYTVTNRGNTTLSNILLDDQHTSATGTAPLAITDGGVVLSLAPLESAMLSAQYEVTQEDVDAGVALTNTVSATATPPMGVATPSDTAPASVSVSPANPMLVALKDVPNLPAMLVAGTDVTFRIRVENTGNVTLNTITLTDTLGRLDGTVISMPTPTGPAADIGTLGQLDVGETWTYALTYTLTQEDVDAGGISNSVLAEAVDPFGTTVDDLSDENSPTGDAPTLVQIPAAPSIEVIKTITTPATTVGAQVVFQIAVENTGNVTLNSVAIASDTITRIGGAAVTGAISGPTFAGADAGSPSGTLVPGETANYTISYTLTQEDIDAGGVRNTATAIASPPSGGPIDDISDDNGIGGSDPTVQVIDAAPSLAIDKRLTAGGPTFDDTTDVLTFAFDVTNTGNVTITTPITVDDPLITGAMGTVVCPPGPLSPMDTVTCVGSYTVTQPDIDAGGVTNVASASTVIDGTTITSPTDTVIVPAAQEPALDLLKVADPAIAATDYEVGAPISYTYTATNTGNTTLMDPIVITDDRIPPAGLSCPAFPTDGLAPTQTYVCTGTYTVTIDDVDVGSVVNNATATSGTTVSPPVSETIPGGSLPALEVTKVLSSVLDATRTARPVAEFEAVGDILVYSFTVENTGTRSFVNEITVVDALLPGSPISCWVPTPGTDPDFNAGQTSTCSGEYEITQAALDAGQVDNTAFASTSFGLLPTTYNSPTDAEVAPAAADPDFDFFKRVTSAPITTVGQNITYEFEVNNTGNQTLTNVTVTDPLLPTLDCTVASLAPGGTLLCTQDYEVTQADVDRGNVVNTASATGTTPANTSLSETAGVTTPMPAANPQMTLGKSASPDPFGPVGSDLIYTFNVTNTGNVTLRNIVVTDPIDPSYSCLVPDLAPLQSNNGCTLAYEVTQDDVDRAEITNTGRVTAVPPSNVPFFRDGATTTPGPTPAPALELTKTSSVDFLDTGGTVTYTFTVVNTGTVTLQPPTFTDTITRLDAANTPTGPIGPMSAPVESMTADNLLEVGEVWTYTATYQISLADADAGGFENTATATASDLLGNVVFDVSDDGDDGDGDTTGDPTRVEITRVPSLEVIKAITTPGAAATDEIVFTITANNTGNVTLTAPVVVDLLTQIDGTPVAGPVGAPVLISGDPIAGVLPGDAFVWELRYTLLQDDVDAGGLSNTATVTASPPPGLADVSDVSRDDDPGDGNNTDDPTELPITRTPLIEVEKTLFFAGDAVGETVIYDVAVRNAGNVTLTGLAITSEDLTNFDGSALIPDSVVQTTGDTTGVLNVGATSVYRVTYTIQQSDIDAGGVLNSATLQATSPTGSPVVDISDTGTGTGSTPTPAPITQIDMLEVGKTAGVPIRINGTLTQVEFEIVISNTGNVTQTGVEVVDDLTVFVAPATLVGVDTPIPSDLNGAAGNERYDGVADTLVLDGAVDLAPGQGGTITLTVRYDIAGGNPASANTVGVTSDRITVPRTAAAFVSGITAQPDLFATKTASPQTAILGDTITYTMTFENRLATAEGALTLIDELPAGLEYTPGTATYNGAATPIPVVVGRQLQWQDVTLAPSEVVTIALQARITGGESGELTNRAFIVAADGSLVSNVATSTVTRRSEALFDCADIIGRVFDDRDFDGVFDEGTEEGLPRVRLVTVDGTLITTDEHGRFSVPCAALPRERIGSNFQLELDDRTLPTGFFITTENPRILRVTPGTMTVFNFGATFGQLIEIDLTAEAFGADGRPSQALVNGVDRLIEVLAERPSVLQLDYYRSGENVAAARARLRAVQQLVQDRWQRGARYDLRVITNISSIQ